MRWGRVGKNGQTSITHTGSNLNKAKDIFCKKFLDKTKNDWDDKDSFIKVIHRQYVFKFLYSFFEIITCLKFKQMNIAKNNKTHILNNYN